MIEERKDIDDGISGLNMINKPLMFKINNVLYLPSNDFIH